MIVPIAYLLLKLFSIPPESVFIVHICIELCTQYARIRIVLPMIRMDIKMYIQEVIKPIGKVIIISPIVPVLLYNYIPQNTLTFLS